MCAPAENRTRGPTMATSDFTTKPLALDVQNFKIHNYIISTHTHTYTHLTKTKT